MKRAGLKPEMKLGADPKRVGILVALLVIGVVVYFMNSSDTPSNPAPSRAGAPNAVNEPSVASKAPARAGQRPSARASNGAQSRGSRLQEFRPSLRPKEAIDPARIDPTLKLSLLAKLQNVSVESAGRSLFDFAAGPPPPPPAAAKTEIAKINPILPGYTVIGPVQPKPPAPAPKPPPTPIPLKFYGFNTVKQGQKRAFFLQGDDIFVAGEGDLIKNRYKVVRIGINSAVVEDTTDQHEQTLPLEAEQVSS